jgi:hypothetical protein
MTVGCSSITVLPDMWRREGEVSVKGAMPSAAVNSRWGALAATLWHRLEGKPAQSGECRTTSP